METWLKLAQFVINAYIFEEIYPQLFAILSKRRHWILKKSGSPKINSSELDLARELNGIIVIQNLWTLKK